ncbi:MAG: protecting protein DprA, nonfunctional protein, partial [Parcubacteria group bacterium GW2011_GWA1_43_21]
PNSYGPNWLIKQGATPICSSADLLEALGLETKRVGEMASLFSELDNSPAENKILALVKNGLTNRDEIVEQSHLPASEANTALMLLVIKNLIRENGSEINLN